MTFEGDDYFRRWGRLFLLFAAAGIFKVLAFGSDLDASRERLMADPGNPLLALDHCRDLLEAGFGDEAEQLLNGVKSSVLRTVESEEETSSSSYVLGLCSLLEGKRYVALGQFKKSIELDPQFVPSVIALAKSYKELGKTDMALEALEDARNRGLNDSQITRALAELTVEKGEIQKAITLFETLKAEYPDSDEYELMLLELYVKNGDAVMAENGFDRLIALGELEVFDKHMRLAQLHLSNGSLDQALRLLQQARKLDASNPLLDEYFARYYVAAGKIAYDNAQFPRAVVFLERANSELEDFESKYLLACSYFKTEDYEAACEQFTALLSDAPQIPEYYTNFALALSKTGKRELAYEIVEMGYQVALAQHNRDSIELFKETRDELELDHKNLTSSTAATRPIE